MSVMYIRTLFSDLRSYLMYKLEWPSINYYKGLGTGRNFKSVLVGL